VDEIGISAPSVGVPRFQKKEKKTSHAAVKQKSKKKYLHLKNKYSKKIKTKKVPSIEK
jgi:hypothetical protein